MSSNLQFHQGFAQLKSLKQATNKKPAMKAAINSLFLTTLTTQCDRNSNSYHS
jgi:hypothetical protein